MSTPEALRLAEMLEKFTTGTIPVSTELRRQHAEIERLRTVEDEWARLSQDEGKAEREIERLTAERDALRREVHNLNWALSMPGFEQMATPEDQAEHDAGVAAIDAMLARMEHNKAQHDAMVKDAERYRKLVATGKYTAACIGGGWGLACGGAPWTKAELDAAADALPDVDAAMSGDKP
jgi:cell division protein FtsB